MLIRLGTRGSQLAMAQSHWVKKRLESHGAAVELVELKTEGDVRTGPLAQIGGQGLFTKRIQQALLDQEIDLAVHSLKDLPTSQHDDLVIAAIPPREATEDALISPFQRWQELPPGAVVGTGSVRRGAQLLRLRPDLKLADIRGNVETRLQKLTAQSYDAIVLACAGLNRVNLDHQITQRFQPDEMLPAVGQGALGLEVRHDQPALIALVRRLNDPASFHRSMAERSMLARLYAGCLAPVGAFTWIENDLVNLRGAVFSRDGQQKIEVTLNRPLEQSSELGIAVAEQLLQQGAGPLLQV